MTHKQREAIARDLLAAKGWISCWFPIGMDLTKDWDFEMKVKSGPLISAMMKIDDVLKAVGHIANGRCKSSMDIPPLIAGGTKPGTAERRERLAKVFCDGERECEDTNKGERDE